MSTTLLTLALLAHPLWRGGGPAEAHELAVEVRGAEERYGLPAGILAAVVLVESRARRRIISPRRRCGGRDIGVAQIHADNPTRQRLRSLLTLSVNLDRAGYLLARSRVRCATTTRRWRVCRVHGPWIHYNANSARWAGAVDRTHRRILEVTSARPPTT